MAVAFLRLTEPVGETGPETAVYEALTRSAPLLLVTDRLDPTRGVDRAIVILKPPSDEPQHPIWQRDDWNTATQFHVVAFVVAGQRNSTASEALLDKYISQIREQIGTVPFPIFFYDPATQEIPDELTQLLTGLAHQMAVTESLSLPLFVQAAGGVDRADFLVDRALARRGGDRVNALEQFAMETRGVLESVTEAWSFEAAVDWLRSPNSYLEGARPIDVLTLEGSRAVVDAAHATAWSLFS